ncbi:MAG: methyltransferase domain-containing protein, partial [Phycisphaerales bacterium]|nr:methyltransferase domain-containing protein [Phycisphaerales bacterium]
MTTIMSGFHAAHAIAGLIRIGAVDALSKGAPISLEDFPEIDRKLLRSFFRYLTTIGVVESRGEDWVATASGRELFTERSLGAFGIFYEAYGEVTSRIPDLLDGTATYGSDVQRDGAALGLHCGLLARRLTPLMASTLRAHHAKAALDIGCGDGSWLIEAAVHDPAFTGLGLDNSSGALGLAQQRADEAGVADRVHFALGDAFDPTTWPELDHIDAITTIGVLHEQFRDGQDAVLGTLSQFAEIMRREDIGTLLMIEPELRHDNLEFDAEFHLIH